MTLNEWSSKKYYSSFCRNNNVQVIVILALLLLASRVEEVIRITLCALAFQGVFTVFEILYFFQCLWGCLPCIPRWPWDCCVSKGVSCYWTSLSDENIILHHHATCVWYWETKPRAYCIQHSANWTTPLTCNFKFSSLKNIISHQKVPLSNSQPYICVAWDKKFWASL